MTLEVIFRIGPSRTEPCRLTDRMAPSGVIIPRPASIQHVWRPVAGRSSGGAAYLQDIERMQWSYSTGSLQNYSRLIALFNPGNPWVWIYMLDPRSVVGIWVEAVMQEPTLARGIGRVAQSVTVQFHRVVRYEP